MSHSTIDKIFKFCRTIPGMGLVQGEEAMQPH